MTVTVFNESFVGISELKLERISDGFILNLPTPANFVVQENKQQKIQRTKSTQGRTVRASSYIAGEEPTLQVDYSHMQPEIMAFRLGNQFEEATYDIRIARTIEVTKTSYAGAAEGFLGYGIDADVAGAVASIRESAGLSVQLTKVAYADFSPTATRSFAVGEHGAMKFTDDLVAVREVVSAIIPHTVTGLALGDELVGAHRVVAHLVDTQNNVWVFMAGNVTPNIEGAGFDPSAETLQLPFFINNPPGACRGWNLYSTGQKVKCAY